MKKFDCSCIGRICIDYLVLVKTFPKKNSKIPFLKFKLNLGGQSAITAVTLARLGTKVNLLSVVGNDVYGKFALKILKQENVNTKNVIKSKKYLTPIAFVWTEKITAKRTIVYQKVNVKNIFSKNQIIETIKNSKLVFIDHQGIKSVLKYKNYFKKYNTKIVFDAERVTDEILKFLPYINYLICSEDFVKEYSKHFKLKNFKTTIKKLSSFGAEIVCCTLGERGACAMVKNKFYFSKAIKVRAIDTTGAGDVFHAGFVYGLLHNWHIKDILKFANYVAGKSCTALGGIDNVPYITEVPRIFLKK